MAIPEIVINERKPIVVYGICQCVLVAIECNQLAIGRQSFENFTGMTSTAKSEINIGARRVLDQCVNAFLKQYGYVIGCLHVQTESTLCAVLFTQVGFLFVEIPCQFAQFIRFHFQFRLVQVFAPDFYFVAKSTQYNIVG